MKAKAGPFDREAPVWPAGTVLSASEVTKTSVTLTWMPAADNTRVSGYKVYLVQGAAYQEVAVLGNVTRFKVDTGLSKDTAYTFTVQALDAAGNASGYAPVLKVTTDHDNRDNNPAAAKGK
ncbi:fibronectin type III domain-containing protein [Gorillibacterium sp. sgz5001074]|uniref:fibronectin type III domain-containing protein n=1 Tax=Gorillibacterium sp. sgz5001074 TaxID=3446695 RepID=UPI003F672496